MLPLVHLKTQSSPLASAWKPNLPDSPSRVSDGEGALNRRRADAHRRVDGDWCRPARAVGLRNGVMARDRIRHAKGSLIETREVHGHADLALCVRGRRGAEVADVEDDVVVGARRVDVAAVIVVALTEAAGKRVAVVRERVAQVYGGRRVEAEREADVRLPPNVPPAFQLWSNSVKVWSVGPAALPAPNML